MKLNAAYVCGSASFVTPLTIKENQNSTTSASPYLFHFYPSIVLSSCATWHHPEACLALPGCLSDSSTNKSMEAKSFRKSPFFIQEIEITGKINAFRFATNSSGNNGFYDLKEGKSHRRKRIV